MLQNARKPDWLKVKISIGEKYQYIKNMVDREQLNTVCAEAKCPNIYECWNNGTATLMILGDICTRACDFCSVKTGKPKTVDFEEPKRIAKAVKSLNLKHVVFTSVDRDDLKGDYGAHIWAQTINETRKKVPGCTIEVLTPDFKGSKPSLDMVLKAKPDIFSHNVECVERISKKIRPQSDWKTSKNVLKYAVNKGFLTKTGIMVGLGETDEEVFETMKEVHSIGVKIFNIGQYLQPTKSHHPVMRYVDPKKFKEFKDYGMEIGFSFVESNPLVRSSYHAEQQVSNYSKNILNCI